MADGRRNNGGKRKGAGRKPKAAEHEVQKRLSLYEEEAHKKLKAAINKGEAWAIKLFFEYMYGKPKQVVDMNSIGNVDINVTFKDESGS